MAVLDAGRSTIDRFGLDGVFVGRVRLGGMVRSPKGLLSLPGGDFLVSGHIGRSDYAIHRVDGETGAVRWSAVPLPAPVRNPRAAVHIVGGPMARAGERSVLLALASPARVYRVDTESGTADLLFEDADALDFVGDDFLQPGRTPGERAFYRWSYRRVTGVTTTPTGGGIVLVITDRENGVSEWRRYSSHGDFEEEVSVRRALEVFEMGRDGRLLAVDWPWEAMENRLLVGRWSR